MLLLEKAQKCYENKSMLENAKWSIRWAKGVVECEEVHSAQRPHSKVHVQFHVHFFIVKQVLKEVHKLELPLVIKVHSTFNVSLLKSFNEDTLWPDHKQLIRPLPNLVGDCLEYEVEAILKCRNHKQNLKKDLVKWQGSHEKKTHLGIEKRHGECKKICRTLCRN